MSRLNLGIKKDHTPLLEHGSAISPYQEFLFIIIIALTVPITAPTAIPEASRLSALTTVIIIIPLIV